MRKYDICEGIDSLLRGFRFASPTRIFGAFMDEIVHESLVLGECSGVVTGELSRSNITERRDMVLLVPTEVASPSVEGVTGR